MKKVVRCILVGMLVAQSNLPVMSYETRTDDEPRNVGTGLALSSNKNPARPNDENPNNNPVRATPGNEPMNEPRNEPLSDKKIPKDHEVVTQQNIGQRPMTPATGTGVTRPNESLPPQEDESPDEDSS